MNYGVILASGKGKRVKDNINIPKQFRELNGIPIIVYTIRKFLDTSSFDYIFIAVSEEYFKSIKQIIDKYFDEEESKKIVVTMGGKERIDSIINVINRIEKVNVIGEDDVVVIHDAVRPFVSNKILLDNMERLLLQHLLLILYLFLLQVMLLMKFLKEVYIIRDNLQIVLN